MVLRNRYFRMIKIAMSGEPNAGDVGARWMDVTE
jgi:hypothetical protein